MDKKDETNIWVFEEVLEFMPIVRGHGTKHESSVLWETTVQ